MPRIPPHASGLAIGAAVVALVAGWFALGFRVDNLHNGLLAVAFTAVGLYVVWQQPGNREGWLFVATGAAQAGMFAARQHGLHTPALPGAAWIGWLGVWPLPLVFVLVSITLMSFPTGRLPSPGWRPVVGVLAVLGVALAAASALWPVEYGRVPLAAPHPLHVPGAAVAEAVYGWAALITYPAFQVVWVVCVVVRLLRARGDEARQLRWFVWASAAAGVVLAVGILGWGTPEPGLLAVTVVPLAAGAAIVKYRLYDIDPVIATTLVWGAMAAVVTFGYVAVVVGLGSLIGGSGTLLALLATALVAVVFEPLRSRAQRLRTGAAAELCATSAWPADAALPDEERTLDELTADGPTVPVEHGGRAVGALAVTTGRRTPMTSAERRLLADLAAQAGLVLELRASAQRLVAAGDAARRRLERDLHDGAQQRLVTVAMELGRLAQTAEEGTALAERAESARQQLLQATGELRETARGLHPAVLTQDGLEAALGFLADRSAVPVRLRVAVGKRLAPTVEATAYYVVSEGLTNTARHAGARVATVTAELTAGGLLLEVGDDGRGGARACPGSGLEGLADRLTALDARLTVDSGPTGTCLRTVIPCA